MEKVWATAIKCLSDRLRINTSHSHCIAWLGVLPLDSPHRHLGCPLCQKAYSKLEIHLQTPQTLWVWMRELRRKTSSLALHPFCLVVMYVFLLWGGHWLCAYILGIICLHVSLTFQVSPWPVLEPWRCCSMVSSFQLQQWLKWFYKWQLNLSPSLGSEGGLCIFIPVQRN